MVVFRRDPYSTGKTSGAILVHIAIHNISKFIRKLTSCPCKTPSRRSRSCSDYADSRYYAMAQAHVCLFVWLLSFPGCRILAIILILVFRSKICTNYIRRIICEGNRIVVVWENTLTPRGSFLCPMARTCQKIPQSGIYRNTCLSIIPPNNL